MEEKIYQKLIAGLKNNSLSERTIRSMAKKAALKVTEESQITDDFVSDYVDVLQELNGQLSKDVAETVKKQLEKTTTSQTSQTAQTAAAPTEQPDLIKRIEEMERKFQESQKQNRLLTIRAEAEEKLKLKQANNQYILKNALAKVEIADGDTADTLAEKVIPIYDNEFKAAFGEGSIPRTGETTQSPEEGKARLLEYKAKFEGKGKGK